MFLTFNIIIYVQVYIIYNKKKSTRVDDASVLLHISNFCLPAESYQLQHKLMFIRLSS